MLVDGMQTVHTAAPPEASSPVEESPATPTAQKNNRPRITSELGSSHEQSSPVDEQELVDLSLDVAGSEEEEEDGEGSSYHYHQEAEDIGRAKVAADHDVLSPRLIVSCLPGLDKLDESDRLSPLLLRLPVTIRSLLSPRPFETAAQGGEKQLMMVGRACSPAMTYPLGAELQEQAEYEIKRQLADLKLPATIREHHRGHVAVVRPLLDPQPDTDATKPPPPVEPAPRACPPIALSAPLRPSSDVAAARVVVPHDTTVSEPSATIVVKVRGTKPRLTKT